MVQCDWGPVAVDRCCGRPQVLYIAELVLALDHLHSQSVVYRDLKVRPLLMISTRDGTHIAVGVSQSRCARYL